MPRALRPALLAAALAACAPAAPAPPVTAPAPLGAAPACLSIVAWNDLHGQLNADDPVVDTGRVPAGGVVALADQIADVRATGDAVVVLDAGDLFTGPLPATLAEGAPVIEAYRLMGVDAAAIGNHEFDFGPVGYERITAAPGLTDDAGPDGPRGALLARMAEASFPFLSANLQRVGGAPTGWKNHRASTTIQRGGFNVGVVGYTTHDTPTTTLAPNVAGLDFKTNAAARVAAEIHALRAQGAAPIVLLAHASIEGELPQTLTDTAEHKGEMASILAGLGADLPDLVVAGHRHAWLEGRVRGVPIVSSSQHGVGLSRIRFCREAVAPVPKLVGVERRVNLADTPPRSELGARVATAMAGWLEKVRPIAEAPVTTIPRECNGRGPRGSRLLDQVARAVADRVADAAAPPAGVPVVAVVNAGGIRAPLPAGPAKYGDLFTVFPFENAVAACGTTRRGLLRFFENAFHKDSSRERFPLGISGAKIHMKKGDGGAPELVSLEIAGQERNTDPDAPVWLALPDFILWGGDALLQGVHCTSSATSQTRVREAWKALLTKEGACDGPSANVVFE